MKTRGQPRGASGAASWAIERELDAPAARTTPSESATSRFAFMARVLTGVSTHHGIEIGGDTGIHRVCWKGIGNRGMQPRVLYLG